MISKIIFEKDRILLALMRGEKADLTHLKNACMMFNEKEIDIFDLSLPDELFFKYVIAVLDKITM